MDREEIIQLIKIGGHLTGAVLYIVVLYTILMCMMNPEVATKVYMNLKGEAWWEILIFPSFGILIFGGLILELKNIKKK